MHNKSILEKPVTCNGSTGTLECLKVVDLVITIYDIKNNPITIKGTSLVVEGRCPLLISLREMAGMNAYLDCKGGRVIICTQDGRRRTVSCVRHHTGLWCTLLKVPTRQSQSSHINHYTVKYNVPTSNKFAPLVALDRDQGNGIPPQRSGATIKRSW